MEISGWSNNENRVLLVHVLVLLLLNSEVLTERCSLRPHFTPSPHHLFPSSLRVSIFARPTCFCCPASRRACRCHCQLFGPSVKLQSRARWSRLPLNLARIFTVPRGWLLMIWWPSDHQVKTSTCKQEISNSNDQIGVTAELRTHVPKKMTSHRDTCWFFTFNPSTRSAESCP